MMKTVVIILLFLFIVAVALIVYFTFFHDKDKKGDAGVGNEVDPGVGNEDILSAVNNLQNTLNTNTTLLQSQINDNDGELVALNLYASQINTNANAAKSDATRALADSSFADTTATNAQSDATRALTNTTSLQSQIDDNDGELVTLNLFTGQINTKANAAQSDATQALANAFSANSAATNAQSDATQALANAFSADTRATSALSDAASAFNAANAASSAVDQLANAKAAMTRSQSSTSLSSVYANNQTIQFPDLESNYNTASNISYSNGIFTLATNSLYYIWYGCTFRFSAPNGYTVVELRDQAGNTIGGSKTFTIPTENTNLNESPGGSSAAVFNTNGVSNPTAQLVLVGSGQSPRVKGESAITILKII